MNRVLRASLVALSLSALPALAAEAPAAKVPAKAAEKAAEPRLVLVGPTITETVFALGAGAQVVGVDDISLMLPGVAGTPKVGYQRALSAETVLALRPTRLLATEEAGPPGVLEQLRTAGTDVVLFPNHPTLDEARKRIREVASRLGREAQGEALVTELDKDLKVAAERSAAAKGRKPVKVLAIYARGANTLMVAGTQTASDELIRLAGAVNAVPGFAGHRPLTAEEVVAAAPDLILIPSGSLHAVGGAEGLQKVPGLAQVKGWKLTTVDDVNFMGLGPRLGKAVGLIQDGMQLPVRSGT
ncbi:ABC transporter substrate-binding protein [Myxococcus sp. K15C18031901]|uniref:heme/hemin ABC transporter substrate-binding protein n=1 Tax=Myxococcus dinghuensis TaxID=2906761 RepID=UPI0020A785F7|nr:ABC transporter substrate-binding protein [Myxococcus dinghuensis]MCP3103618.1 ABC transporter substrate-binding protein [Myxococcus dinghuensis]